MNENIRTGSDNIFLGSNAGFSNETGNDNFFVGRCAGLSNIGILKAVL